jgi:hypothetical protein
MATSAALDFYSATGHLVYKKIFPALKAMIRHGLSEVPIIRDAKIAFGKRDFC